jgi:hypothetical protein
LAASAQRGGERSGRRDRHSEDDGGGSAVVGFGSDVPAFMQLRLRAAPVEVHEGDSEA